MPTATAPRASRHLHFAPVIPFARERNLSRHGAMLNYYAGGGERALTPLATVQPTAPRRPKYSQIDDRRTDLAGPQSSSSARRRAMSWFRARRHEGRSRRSGASAPQPAVSSRDVAAVSSPLRGGDQRHPRRRSSRPRYHAVTAWRRYFAPAAPRAAPARSGTR